MDYIEALETSLDEKSEKELLPLQPGDVPDTYADVDDLVEQFGYKPNMRVKQGVENFARWYNEYNESESRTNEKNITSILNKVWSDKNDASG